jgi:hypothetical protein
MSISYPTGLKAQYTGALEQQASNSSGSVTWAWNRAQTQLDLAWVTSSTYSASGGFQGLHDKLAANATVIQLDQGNATISGHSWEYRTYSLSSKGTTSYLAAALAYYPSSGRGYILLFIDTGTNVLSSLEYYGATFSG